MSLSLFFGGHYRTLKTEIFCAFLILFYNHQGLWVKSVVFFLPCFHRKLIRILFSRGGREALIKKSWQAHRGTVPNRWQTNSVGLQRWTCQHLPNHQRWHAKWKLSWNMCAMRTRFCTFGSDFVMLSLWLLTKFLRRRSVGSLFKSALLVGQAYSTVCTTSTTGPQFLVKKKVSANNFSSPPQKKIPECVVGWVGRSPCGPPCSQVARGGGEEVESKEEEGRPVV